MKYRELIQADMRLAILQILNEGSVGGLNHHILRGALGIVGHQPSMDSLRAELAWLDEQGMVDVRHAGETIVAHLTERGEDVALGRTAIPGIKRPSMGVRGGH